MNDNRSSKKPRGRPFRKGAPSANLTGRPKGSRNRITEKLETKLAENADEIIDKLIELAKNSDLRAIRLCLEPFLPERPEQTMNITLPELNSAADAVTAIGSIYRATRTGHMTITQAMEISRLVDVYVRALEAVEAETRLQKIEEWEAQKRARQSRRM